jgi:hypothetical protein
MWIVLYNQPAANIYERLYQTGEKLGRIILCTKFTTDSNKSWLYIKWLKSIKV